MQSYYDTITPLMEQKSLLKNPAEFQRRVNVIFHDVESKHYDSLHQEMWKSLPLQYTLLVDDVYDKLPKRKLSLLDIGCGTGLATDLLLQTKLGEYIHSISLLDTSASMLTKAERRSKFWKKSVDLIHGNIENLIQKYDFIVISSVLHHIPDLDGFFARICEHQNPGGFFMIIHDPLSESINSSIYKKRCRDYRDYCSDRLMHQSMSSRIVNKLKRVFKCEVNYIKEVNDRLISEGVVYKPLTEVEIWSVTDIHVEDLPYSTGLGISLELIKKKLEGYSLLTFRTYSFFGVAASQLKGDFSMQESELIANRDKNGRNLGSVWQKNS